jgi:ribosomal protein S18 acetylase RimI-like enzyme
VHDAYAHIEEDILVHGPGDRNDDAILEKGNRRKKRLGDRCVFRGGKNNGTCTYSIRVKEKVNGKWTGNYVKKQVTRRTVAGQAAQVQVLDMIAQIRESTRATAAASLSVKQLETKAEEKVAREVQRTTALDAVKEYAEQKKRERDDAAAPAPAPAAAPAAAPTAVLPTFESFKSNCVPMELQQQLTDLEALHMAGYERNGTPFAEYFGRNDLTVHVARRAGMLLGFAIDGDESQRMRFLYELHTVEAARKLGIARRLLQLVEAPRKQSSKSTKKVQLNVHGDNKDAQDFYLHMGFKPVGTAGIVLLFER